MTRIYTHRPISRWQPRIRPKGAKLGTRAKYWCDYDREIIFYYDGYVIHELELTLLNSRVLTYLMIEGAIEVMRRSDDAQTTWLTLRNGKQLPRLRNEPKNLPKIKPLPALTQQREAIVLATMGYSPRIPREWAEARVRNLTRDEVTVWLKEPDVTMHLRQIRGLKVLRTTEMARELLKTGAPALKKRGRSET